LILTIPNQDNKVKDNQEINKQKCIKSI
jgi:hypothetical protein